MMAGMPASQVGPVFPAFPSGEVKGVDVHRHAGLRGQDVARGKAAFFDSGIGSSSGHTVSSGSSRLPRLA
jgi:hypothetical protein